MLFSLLLVGLLWPAGTGVVVTGAAMLDVADGVPQPGTDAPSSTSADPPSASVAVWQAARAASAASSPALHTVVGSHPAGGRGSGAQRSGAPDVCPRQHISPLTVVIPL